MTKGGGMAEVAIFMGSDSDFPNMRDAGAALKDLGIKFEFHIMYCRRNPKELFKFVKGSSSERIKLFIAGAAYAA